jgi:hypothetical protein
MLPLRFGLRTMMIAVFVVAVCLWAIRTIASMDNKEAAACCSIGLWGYTVALIAWWFATPVSCERNLPIQRPRISVMPLIALAVSATIGIIVPPLVEYSHYATLERYWLAVESKALVWSVISAPFIVWYLVLMVRNRTK